MNTVIFNFGIKHRESRFGLLRFLAELCITEEKKAADKIERTLKRERIQGMSADASGRIWNTIQESCLKKK